MFNHCQTFAELNTAYEQAVEAVNVKHKASMAAAFGAAMRAGRPDLVPADPREVEWDAIKAAMQVRWEELDKAGAE